VYSPHGKELLTAFEQAYEKLHPDVDVQWLDMGSQDAFDRIRTERENPQADIWWGAPSTTFAKAEKDSLLEKYVPTWDGAVKPEMKSEHGYWYGTFLTPEVIMYNNHVLNENTAPHDWDDLLDAKWRNKIIIRYPIASGTMRIIFSAILEREAKRTGTTNAGFDWLLRLDANTKDYAADPTQMYLKIAREEGLVSLWDLPDVMLQTHVNGYPFGYILPASGTPLIVDCIAIVKGTKHLAEAERFYEFVTSREALIRQAKDFGRIPARNDIPTSDLPPWIAGLDLKAMDVDWGLLEANEKQWMKLWEDDVKGKGSSMLSATH
jgi:iron(III) transport system substrate-binding protein